MVAGPDIPLWMVIAFPVAALLIIIFALYCCCKNRNKNKIEIKETNFVTEARVLVTKDDYSTNKALDAKPNAKPVRSPTTSLTAARNAKNESLQVMLSR